MPKPLSQYSLDALALLGQLIHEARLSKGMTSVDLATRAGISRVLLQRIEKGESTCSIGAVFEVATICGVTLFERDARTLTNRLAMQNEKSALLPKAVRSHLKVLKDDF